MDRWIGLCRPGFEGDLAAELTTVLAEEGVGGYARTEAGEGLVVRTPDSPPSEIAVSYRIETRPERQETP